MKAVCKYSEMLLLDTNYDKQINNEKQKTGICIQFNEDGNEESA